MEEVEARLLGTHQAELEEVRKWTFTAFCGLAVFGLLGGGAAVWLLSSGVVRRVQSLEENAGRLSQELPLLPMSAGTDEIGRLEQGLQAASLLLATRSHALRTETERLTAEVIERQRTEEALRESTSHLETALHGHERSL